MPRIVYARPCVRLGRGKHCGRIAPVRLKDHGQSVLYENVRDQDVPEGGPCRDVGEEVLAEYPFGRNMYLWAIHTQVIRRVMFASCLTNLDHVEKLRDHSGYACEKSRPTLALHLVIITFHLDKSTFLHAGILADTRRVHFGYCGEKES